MESNKRPGRPKIRTGNYQKVTVEIRTDLVEFLDRQPQSYREIIEELLVDWKEAKEQDEMSATKALSATLEKFIVSPDFKSGVMSATKASWGGSGYSVEIFEDGTWSVLWNNQIGNLYESKGQILHLPTLDTEDMSEYVEGGAGSEDDFLSEGFEMESSELADELREQMR